jgi:hypothetical protein
MNDISVYAQAVTVKTEDGRDTREILKVESVGHNSRRVMTVDKDMSFVSYCFGEIVAEYKEVN